MANIIYDIEELKKTRKEIIRLRDALNEENRNLNSALGELEEKWQTDAGKTFFEDHRDIWSEYVRKYVQKLEGFINMLQVVISQYEEIGNEVKNLRI